MAFLVNLATGFVQFGFSLTLPSMEEALHLSHTEAGLLITVGAAIRMGGALAAGTLAPRYGSRTMIVSGAVAVGASMVLLGFAQNYGMALVASVLMGIGGGVTLTPMMGLLSAWFLMSDRGLAAGIAASGGSISYIIAGVLVPILTEASWENGWRHSWQLFGVLVLAVAVVSLLFVRERPPPELPEGERQAGRPALRQGQGSVGQAGIGRAWPVEAFKHPAVWLITLIAFTSGWAQNLFTTFFGLYLTQDNGVSLATVGQLVVLIGTLSIGSGIVWGWFSDKLGRGQAFGYSFVVQGASFVLLAVVPGFVSFLIASILMGVTLRATYTICAASAGDYVPVRFSAAAFAVMSVGAGFGSTISPTIGGLVADYVSMKWVFWMAAGGSVVGTMAAIYLQTRRQPSGLPTQA